MNATLARDGIQATTHWTLKSMHSDPARYRSPPGPVSMAWAQLCGMELIPSTSDQHGFECVDLTQNGKNTGLALLFGAEPTTANMTLRIYQGNSDNFSEALVTVPATVGGLASEFLVVPFSQFQGNVQPTNVDAIRMTIDSGVSATDTEVALTGAIGPVIANFEHPTRVDLTITKNDQSPLSSRFRN